MKKSAVIDIGSNSVRLVIYRLVRSAAIPNFNEKVMAGLGRNLTETGNLSPDGRVAALSALQRYRAILTALDVTDVHVFATAAVREANDGEDFVVAARKILGEEIRVLSGMDEARLSAFGVISASYNANGVTGDLGGTSLEFSQISDGGSNGGETHLLGPLSFTSDQTPKERRKVIRSRLKESEIVRRRPGGVFYAVGGAWRAMAKLHIAIKEYPLSALHGYRIGARELSQFARHVIVGSPVMKSQIREVSGRSPSSVIHATMVLDQVFELGGFDELFVCAAGVREGVLAEAGGDEAGDPLIDGIAATAHLDETQYAFGDELLRFVKSALRQEQDLFGYTASDERLDRAACMLADSGARLHADHRADLAYDLALRGAYMGATHEQRAYLALAVGCRYYKSFRRPKSDRILMPQQRADRARELGALMRLGCVFSGRSAPILKRASLLRNADELILQVDKNSEAMVSESVRKRLSQAARHMQLKPGIEIG